MQIKLPAGWKIKECGKKFPLISVWSSVGIYNEKNEYIEAAGYNIYKEYEGTEDVPQAIYNQIALGNNYRFNAQPVSAGGKYKPIVERENGVTAVTEVYYSANISKEFGYGENVRINKAILSYNKDLHIYIAIKIDADAISEHEVEILAQSIILIPATGINK